MSYTQPAQAPNDPAPIPDDMTIFERQTDTLPMFALVGALGLLLAVGFASLMAYLWSEDDLPTAPPRAPAGRRAKAFGLAPRRA